MDGRKQWIALRWSKETEWWTTEERGRLLFLTERHARAAIGLLKDHGAQVEDWSIVDVCPDWWDDFCETLHADRPWKSPLSRVEAGDDP